MNRDVTKCEGSGISPSFYKHNSQLISQEAKGKLNQSDFLAVFNSLRTYCIYSATWNFSDSHVWKRIQTLPTFRSVWLSACKTCKERFYHQLVTDFLRFLKKSNSKKNFGAEELISKLDINRYSAQSKENA